MPQALIPVVAAAAGAGINAVSEAARQRPKMWQEMGKLPGVDTANLEEFKGIQGADQMRNRAQKFADNLMLGPDTTLDTARSEGGAQGLAGQQFLQGELKKGVLGLQPSVAEQQLRAGQSRNVAANMAMAASARGPQGVAGSQYQAAQNIAGQNLLTNQQATMERAAEQQRARTELAGLSGTMRQQGMGMADLGLKSLLGRYNTGLGFEGLGLDIASRDAQQRQKYLALMQDYQLGLEGKRNEQMKMGNENTQFYTKYLAGSAQGANSGETKGGHA